jgi:pimeloyl-ACP methyl ester carboxylesterase
MVEFDKKESALVLLHGFCEDNSIWSHIIPELVFDGIIIAPNLPGFGNSNLESTVFGIEDIAGKIHHSLSVEGIKKIICIGHSLGGYITLALKKNYPAFIESLGLIHSTAYADTKEKIITRNKLIKFLDNNPASLFLSTFAPSLFSEVNQKRLKNDIEKVINMSINLKNTTIQAYVRAMRDREDYSKILFQEINPLFIAGKNDTAVPIENSESQIAKIENRENNYLLKNVAHMGMYESPSIIIKAINQFTSNNPLANR